MSVRSPGEPIADKFGLVARCIVHPDMDLVLLPVRQVIERDLVSKPIGRLPWIGSDNVRVLGGNVGLIGVLPGVKLDRQAVEQAAGTKSSATLAKRHWPKGIIVQHEGNAVPQGWPWHPSIRRRTQAD